MLYNFGKREPSVIKFASTVKKISIFILGGFHSRWFPWRSEKIFKKEQLPPKGTINKRYVNIEVRLQQNELKR